MSDKYKILKGQDDYAGLESLIYIECLSRELLTL